MKPKPENIVVLESVRSKKPSKLRQQFERFLKLEKEVDDIEPLAYAGEKEALASAIIDLQTSLVKETVNEPAATVGDVAHKLAMWRIWSGVEAGNRTDDISISDELVLSALEDLEALEHKTKGKRS